MSRRYSFKLICASDIALTLGKEYGVRVYDGDAECVMMFKYIRPHTRETVIENDVPVIDDAWIFELMPGDPNSGRFVTAGGVMLDDNSNTVTIVEVRLFMVVAVGDVNAVEAALRLQEMMQMMTVPVQFQKIEMPKHEVADRPCNRNWHITSRNKRKK
jgi:hypothetical protein